MKKDPITAQGIADRYSLEHALDASERNNRLMPFYDLTVQPAMPPHGAARPVSGAA